MTKPEAFDNIVFTRAGGVPGGHFAPSDKGKKPFIPPMKECHSIPLRHSDVVVDIGAYVGTYSIYAARHPVRQVIAYEPTPASFEVMERTPLHNLRNVQAAVVGDDSKQVELYISRGIGVTNSTLPSDAKDPVLVDAVRYEEAVRGATVVKIDVEGAEYTYDIVQPSVRAFIIDFHPLPGEDFVPKAQRIVEQLHDHGFEDVVTPNFERSGWDRAGSWVRPMETEGQCDDLMNGHNCVGCARKLAHTLDVPSLCPRCYAIWSKKHREGFFVSELSE